MIHNAYKQYEQNPKSFRDILQDAEKPYIYVQSIISFGANKKMKYGWFEQGFDTLLEVLSDMFSENNNVSMLCGQKNDNQIRL